MKEQDQRRHGIDRPLKRETACPRLMSDAFQPPCNFDPESRATPTTATSIPKEIRAGVSNNADTNVKQTDCLYKVETILVFHAFAVDPPKSSSTSVDYKFRSISRPQLTAMMKLSGAFVAPNCTYILFLVIYDQFKLEISSVVLLQELE